MIYSGEEDKGISSEVKNREVLQLLKDYRAFHTPSGREFPEHALKAGRPIHEVSEMLGHKDPAMTFRRYSHVLDDMGDATARAMEEAF